MSTAAAGVSMAGSSFPQSRGLNNAQPVTAVNHFPAVGVLSSNIGHRAMVGSREMSFPRRAAARVAAVGRARSGWWAVLLATAALLALLGAPTAQAQPSGPLPIAPIGDFTRAVIDQYDPSDAAQHAGVGDFAEIRCVASDQALVITASDRPAWWVPRDALTPRAGVHPRACGAFEQPWA